MRESNTFLPRAEVLRQPFRNSRLMHSLDLSPAEGGLLELIERRKKKGAKASTASRSEVSVDVRDPPLIALAVPTLTVNQANSLQSYQSW